MAIRAPDGANKDYILSVQDSSISDIVTESFTKKAAVLLDFVQISPLPILENLYNFF